MLHERHTSQPTHTVAIKLLRKNKTKINWNWLQVFHSDGMFSYSPYIFVAVVVVLYSVESLL